jgi:hypothetical protein
MAQEESERAERLIAEFRSLVRKKYGVELPSKCQRVLPDGKIALYVRGRWYGSMGADYFEQWLVMPLRKDTEAKR